MGSRFEIVDPMLKHGWGSHCYQNNHYICKAAQKLKRTGEICDCPCHNKGEDDDS